MAVLSIGWPTNTSQDPWVQFTDKVYETNIRSGTDLWAPCHCPWPQKQIAPHGMWRHPLPLCCHRNCTARAHPSWSEQRSHGQAGQEEAPHYKPMFWDGSGAPCCMHQIPALAAMSAAVMAQAPVVAPAAWYQYENTRAYFLATVGFFMQFCPHLLFFKYV